MRRFMVHCMYGFEEDSEEAIDASYAALREYAEEL